MLNVPDYAKVDKATYRQLRNELHRASDIYGFDFTSAWNVMIQTIQERHAKVLKKRAKNDITLDQAVPAMIKRIKEEALKRAKQQRELAEARRALRRAHEKAS